jgi:hypothetical protein
MVREVTRRLQSAAATMVMLAVMTAIATAAGYQTHKWLMDSRGAGETPAGWPDAESQIVLVFIGASTCAFSQPASVKRALEAAEETLARLAQHGGLRVKKIGVSVDISVAKGIEYLTRVGEFDEVLIGGGGTNIGFEFFAATVLGGPLVTPQILIVERHPRSLGQNPDGGMFHVRVRVAGGSEVERWGAAGAPVPASLSSQ